MEQWFWLNFLVWIQKYKQKVALATIENLFVVIFFTLTRKLTKDGYLSQSKKPFFIQFFGKTKAFT